MKPITSLLENYKHKMYCDKQIKDYVLDIEELSKSNNTNVTSYIELVKKAIVEVPALKRIASNETRELKANETSGNCTYVIPPSNETTDSTANDSSSNITGSGLNITDSNTTDNATASMSPLANSTAVS
jgi:hypothetical protein